MLPEYLNKGDGSVAQYSVFPVYYPIGLLDVGEILLELERLKRNYVPRVRYVFSQLRHVKNIMDTP